jgi:hypothetical protein
LVFYPPVSAIPKKRVRSEDLPAAPRSIYLPDLSYLATVVISLRGKVLLHEEVRLARIDRVLEVLKVIKDDDAGVGFVGVGELALLVGKDEAYYVAAGPDA